VRCSLRILSLLPFLVSIGCSDELVPPSPPEHPHGGPTLGEVRWWVDDSVRVSSLVAGIDEWNQALGCGLLPIRVDDRDDADIIFEFDSIEERWDDMDSGYLSVTRGRRGVSIVKLDEWNTESLARGQVLHVWGHALGYAHAFSNRPSVLDSVPVYPLNQEIADSGIRGEELDSIRAWALQRGAPGCGDREMR
jgi:hypothetical protein